MDRSPSWSQVQMIYRSCVGKRALPIMCVNYTWLLTTVFSVSVILVWMHVKYLKIKDEIQCLWQCAFLVTVCTAVCSQKKKERNTNILAAGDFWQTNMPWIFGAFRRMLINFKIWKHLIFSVEDNFMDLNSMFDVWLK